MTYIFEDIRQSQYISQLIRNKIPEQLHVKLIELLTKLDETVRNPKSKVIYNYLRDYIPRPDESENHILDRIEQELAARIEKDNSKDPQHKIKSIKERLVKAIPGIDNDTMEHLVQRVIKDNISVDKVINQYGNSNTTKNKIIYVNGSYKVIEITQWESGRVEKHMDTGNQEPTHKLLGGTKWCTRFKNYFDKYLQDGPLYLIMKYNKPIAMVHKESDTLDINDTKPNKHLTNEIRNNIKIDIPLNLPSYTDRDPIREIALLTEPIKLNEVARYIRDIGERWPEAEPYIMKDPALASMYAGNVIGGRWPEAEPYIVKNPFHAYHYAYGIIGGRWPEAEPYIMKDPVLVVSYANDVIRGRWPEAEPYIMKNPAAAFEYARDVIGSRWPEAEPYIMKNPLYACEYACSVIDGRWPEAEPYIAGTAFASTYDNFITRRGGQ